MISTMFETIDLEKRSGKQSPPNVSSQQNHHKQSKYDINLEYDRHISKTVNKINARIYHSIDSKRRGINKTVSGVLIQNCPKGRQTNLEFSYDLHLPEIEQEINPGAYDMIDAERGRENQTPLSILSAQNNHKSGWTNPTFDYDQCSPEIRQETNPGVYDKIE